MGFITQEELKSRLENSNNLAVIFKDEGKDVTVKNNEKVIDNILNGVKINSGETRNIGNGGKVDGDVNVPQVLRNVIGIQANFDKPKNVAKTWGISTVQASKFANGRVNSSGYGNTEADMATSKAVNGALDKVRDVATERILKAIECITDDKLENRKAKELSTIASNLSRVLNVVMPKDKDKENPNPVQVIFMTPRSSDHVPLTQFKQIEV